MPDAIFGHPRLAAVYDDLDADRRDLDHYVSMVAEFDARVVLDVGCGTGTFACRLAAAGVDVVAVDPASASLDVARRKPGANHVRWLLGDATTLPAMTADIATMTGNVAQVFLTNTDWSRTLACIGAALKPGGHLVFETRNPARRAWAEWTRERTFKRVSIAGIGPVQSWVELTDVSPPFVSFDSHHLFEVDGTRFVSTSTLRFRDLDETTQSLVSAGFDLLDVRDAPDRPGREFVFVAQSNPDRGPGGS